MFGLIYTYIDDYYISFDSILLFEGMFFDERATFKVSSSNEIDALEGCKRHSRGTFQKEPVSAKEFWL